VLFDSGTRVVTYCRAPYDVALAQKEIREAGLPPILADRLSVGR
jgi:rhodanese-related sulfurtransferase